MRYTNKIPYIILSYPRSGNHWVRYIVEWFSRRATVGNDDGEHEKDVENIVDSSICKRTDIDGVDEENPIAKKRHSINDWDSRDCGLLCIYRNFYECIVRQLHLSDCEDFSIKNEKVTNNINWYVKILKQFDSWNSNKLIINYENLLIFSDNFDSELKKILQWMDIFSEESYCEFINNKQFRKDNSLKAVLSREGTDGNYEKYYVKELSDVDRKDWEKYIYSIGKDVIDKYCL